MKLLYAIIFILIGSACTKESKELSTLRLSLPAEISTLDPANCFDTVCYQPLMQVYETLYEIEYLKRPYTLRPLLAEGHPSISPDRLKYTFKLKKGIKYHASEFLKPGREVIAQDIVNQIKRVAFQGTRSQGYWAFDQKIVGLNEWREKVGQNLDLFFKEQISGLTTPDDYTLEVKLTRPYPQLIWIMSLNFTTPIPEEGIRATSNNLSSVFFGTGPYVIKSFNPNQEVSLVKNNEYLSSKFPIDGDEFAKKNNLLKDAGSNLPFISQLKFIVIKEGQTEWLNFLAKKIDFINLVKDQYPLALNENGTLKDEILKQNIKFEASPTSSYWWIAFNMKDPVIGKNLYLRKAIASAIDTDKFLEIFTFNAGQKANSIFPPSIPGYDPKAKLPYNYNIEEAKEYLKKAGFPEGKGLPVLTYDVRGSDTRKRQMGEFIQQELKKIGINVVVRVNTFPAFLEKARNGELQFWQGGWVLDYPDAENVLQLLTTANLPPGPNASQYSNPAFDKLYEELKEMQDSQEKQELMKKMENLVLQDLPWAIQYYSRSYVLYHGHLLNYRYSDIIYNSIKYLKISSHL